MRRLIVMRHAQSSAGSSMTADHERPIDAHGQRQAPLVARQLAGLGWSPDAVLSSDSTRTRQTWSAMSSELPGTLEPLFLRALYCAGLDAVWEASHQIDPGRETLLVLGHNPGWSQAIHHLAGRSQAMAPANAALLEGTGEDWPHALEASWRLVDVLRPRDLDI